MDQDNIWEKFQSLLVLRSFDVRRGRIRADARILGGKVPHLKSLAQNFLKLGGVAVCFAIGNPRSKSNAVANAGHLDRQGLGRCNPEEGERRNKKLHLRSKTMTWNGSS